MNIDFSSLASALGQLEKSNHYSRSDMAPDFLEEARYLYQQLIERSQ